MPSAAALPSLRPVSPTVLLRKRIVDVVASSAGLIVLLPVFALVAAAIKLDSPGPVLFRQSRVGKGGVLFKIHKFRSMVVDAPTLGGSLTVRNDARVTAVGAFLRRHKLDELPQLIDVFLGDMSLVGPRPEVPNLFTHYTAEQARLICSVPPGMTDFASIRFRDESALIDQSIEPEAYYRDVIMPIKMFYYGLYLREIGFVTDLRIIMATISILAFGVTPKGLMPFYLSEGPLSGSAPPAAAIGPNQDEAAELQFLCSRTTPFDQSITPLNI